MWDASAGRGRSAAISAVAALVAPFLALTVVVAAGVALFEAAMNQRALYPVLLAYALAVTPLVRALPRKRGEEPWPATADSDAFDELAGVVAEEAAALEVRVPEALRLTLDDRLELRVAPDGRRTLLVGLALLAVSRGPALRAEVDAELRSRGTAAGRRLLGLWARLSAIEATLQEDGFIGWPSLQLVRPLRRIAERALRAQSAVVAEEIASRHGEPAAAHAREASTRSELFDRYWLDDVVPCLDAGFLPPILEGWVRVLAVPEVAELHALEPRDPPREWRALEARLVRERPGGGALVPIEWERVPGAVWVRRLQAEAAAAGPLVAGRTIGELAELRLEDMAAAPLAHVGAVVAVALDAAGWRLTTAPGEPIWAQGPEVGLLPFELVHRLSTSAEARAGWEREAAEHGIAGVPLDVPEASAPPPTRAPGSVRLPLVVSRPVRRRLVARAATYTLLTLFVLAIALGAAFAPNIPTGGRAFIAAMSLATLAMLAYFVRSSVRLLRGSGALVIDGDAVRVSHPGLLREPWQLPRYLLRTVAYDDADERRDGSGRRVRLLWGESVWDHPGSLAAGACGWLWSDDGPAIPMVAAPSERPNLALVFTEPVAGPRMRRDTDTGPLPGEAIGGLLLVTDPVTDPAAALAGADLLGELTSADARLLEAAYTGAG